MQQNAECDADKGAEHGEDGDDNRRADGKLRQSADGKVFGRNAERSCDAVGNQRCDHARNQRGIVHDADADDLHGKDSGCHRGAEKRRKRRAHAAHNHDMLVLLVKAEQPSEAVSDAAAKLQRSAFPSGGAAEQVGDQRGDKDERSHPKRNIIPRMDGRKHKIRAGILLVV